MTMRTRTGAVAMFVTLAAWAAFGLSARAITHSHLGIVDVTLLRYLVPTLVLVRWWGRAWREVQTVDLRLLMTIAVGAGAPFFLLTALGAQLSTASHVTVVNLGAAPLIIAVIMAVTARLRPRPAELASLAVIGAGIVVLALGTPGGGWGVLVLLGSAVLWAAYTIAQERARLSAIAVILVMCAPSAAIGLFVLPLRAARFVAHPGETVAFALIQGLGTGVVSTVAFTLAVRGLGAELCNLVGALTPVLVAVLSTVVFHEPLTSVGTVGLALVVLGVLSRLRATRTRTPETLNGRPPAGGRPFRRFRTVPEPEPCGSRGRAAPR